MKAGSFNIHDYLGNLYDNADETVYNKLNEEKETEKVPSEGLIIPEENKNSYEWLKNEYKKGKTEVKVEMSSHTFKPGYSTEGVKDFKPEMKGQVKTGENKVNNKTTSTFKQNNFKTSSTSDNKIEDKDTKKEGEKNKPKVEVKTKAKENDKKEDKEKEGD
jgi:cbb3-type cytochrome oxidase cytochrome c subunit